MIFCELQITFVARKINIMFHFYTIKYIMYESILTTDELRLISEHRNTMEICKEGPRN